MNNMQQHLDTYIQDFPLNIKQYFHAPVFCILLIKRIFVVTYFTLCTMAHWEKDKRYHQEIFLAVYNSDNP